MQVDPRYTIALAITLGAAMLFFASSSEGTTFWLGLLLTSCCAWFIAEKLFQLIRASHRSPRLRLGFNNISLFIVTTLFCMLWAEAGFALWERLTIVPDTDTQAALNQTANTPLLMDDMLSSSAAHAMAGRRYKLIMPDHWQHKSRKVEGARRAFMWHDALHVQDQNGFRRTSALPPKDSEKFRIVVLGDSLTYGYGIEQNTTYPALIEKRLAESFSVEVLNLGVSGRQSEDIVKIARKFLPQLRPDLVIYGVCLNDFLPSGTSQKAPTDYTFSLPGSLKTFFVQRSRAARFISEAYGAALMGLSLRQTFMDEILESFDDYQVRFAADVQALGALAQVITGHPPLGIVLHQAPVVGGVSQQVTHIAETALADGGFSVIETAEYFRHYDRQALGVSRWEGHPNELAHALFASMLIPSIEEISVLQGYMH